MLKRFIIFSIFFSWNALVIFGIYFFFFRVTPTCFDSIQNQNEQGIDCGGRCTNACVEVVVGKEFQVEEVAFVAGGENQYDVLGTIFNQNEGIGAPSFRYTFELKNSSGQVIGTQTGNGAILPRARKNLIALNIETREVPVSATLTFSDIIWERSTGYQEEPIIRIYQQSYHQVIAGFGFSEVYGLVSNESPYDFRSIIIQVILRDRTGKLLALNTTEMRTITSQESRDFKLVWPTPFPGTVEQVDMVVDADVYHSENFVKQYFPGGQY